MLVDKQSELMSDLLFTVHQHGGDDVTWKPPITVVYREIENNGYAKLFGVLKTRCVMVNVNTVNSLFIAKSSERTMISDILL